MLTVAIPTMRRWNFLKDSIPVFLDRKEVAEVLICDETGEDTKEIMKAFPGNPRIRCIVNPRRLGIYENKRKCLENSKTVWTALLDSDNMFNDEWFDVLMECDFTNTKAIYASAEFKSVDIATGQVSDHCSQFSGLSISSANWNSMFKKPKWNFLLNDGNWVLPTEAVKHLSSTVTSKSLEAADAIYMLKCFIKGGYTITYVPSLVYTHTIHPGSSWLETDRESSRILSNTVWTL